jgi:hypothetical protein
MMRIDELPDDDVAANIWISSVNRQRNPSR